MTEFKLKSIADFLKAKNKGQREFDGWDFEENSSVRDLNLSGLTFRNCFLFLDLTNSNLENSMFVGCNLKTADFSKANLKNCFVKNCMIEGIVIDEAILDGAKFIDNYAYGAVVKQKDFDRLYNPDFIETPSKEMSQNEALKIAHSYLTNHPNINVKITNSVMATSWIDGHINIDEPVWIICCENLNENPMDGNHFLSIVIKISTGKVEDVKAD